MTQYMSGVLALVVGLAVGTAEGAPYTFFSGTVDVNGAAVGGAGVNDAKRISASSGGIGYNNSWTSGGGPLFGSKLTAAGIVPVTNAISQNVTTNFPNTNIVAVYAFEGLFGTATGGPGSNFNPDVTVPGGTLPVNQFGGTAGGVLQFYDRTNIGSGFDATDPSTWVTGSTLLAEVRITDRADGGYKLGPPGPQTTVAPTVIDPQLVNGIGLQLGQPTQDLSGDFKFAFNGGDMPDLGSLFSDLKVFADFDGNLIEDLPGTFERISADLFTNLDQVLQIGNPTLDAAGLASLNSLFDSLLDSVAAGDHLFSDETVNTGDNFDNVSNNNTPNPTNGDLSVINNGGNAIPGGQFRQIVNPEPTTWLVWGVVGLVGAATARRFRK